MKEIQEILFVRIAESRRFCNKAVTADRSRLFVFFKKRRNFAATLFTIDSYGNFFTIFLKNTGKTIAAVLAECHVIGYDNGLFFTPKHTKDTKE